jgi:hypothetical protein
MQLSHRDRRVARDIGRFAWVMLGLVLGLGVLAFAAPLVAVRFAAVAGLAGAGAAFLWQAGKAVGEYVRDLEQVRDGAAISGRIRVEVSSDVGLDPRARRLTRAVPPVRRRPPPMGGSGAPPAEPTDRA